MSSYASDRDLVQAMCRGDGAAWEAFVTRYLRLIAHVVRRTLEAYRVLHTQDDVEDLTYEILQNLVRNDYRALAAIGEPYDMKAYLAVAARRKAIDFARRPRDAALSLDQPAGGEEGALADIVPAPGPAEGDSVPAAPLRVVREAMGRLPARERLLVKLFYLKRKKYREIARIVGIPVNSIGPTLGRAIEKIQRMLGPVRHELS